MLRSISFVITYLLVFTTSLQVSAAKTSYSQSAVPVDSYLVRRAERYLQQATPLADLPPSQPSPTSGLDHCDGTRGLCGAYGICTIGNSSFCQCLQGFKPKFALEWSSKNWSQGCVRDTPLNCKEKDVDNFLKVSRLKLPNGMQILQDRSIGLEECGQQCSRNCSCTAYTMVNSTDVVGDGALFPYGCALWFSDLVNVRELSTDTVGGQDLYIRVAGNISANHQSQGHKAKLAGLISGAVVAAMSSVVLLVCCILKMKRKNFERAENDNSNTEGESKQVEDLELPLFELENVISATDDFSINNKLGEGGFGPVYWGKLNDGQEIAVKRLSKRSGQGLTEFKNEVKLIAKVQHRNLVKLLGCCIQGEEPMLVYEYMPNNSLDSFLFDDTRRKVLDWAKRFHIIRGIARGLLYLHHDSRLRIIHRDLKASNILLDYQFNPKISDFGMARIFCGDQSEEMTKRVVGTYGYMAPEYAIDGLFSVKSDVFSFGILLLEIVSGKRNTGFCNPNDFHNLITFAWKLRKEGRLLEIVDTYLQEDDIDESCNESEVLRCLHISLLCLQRHPKDRPSMASVVQMLGSEIALSEPKQPGFLLGNNSIEEEPLVKEKYSRATNDFTISILEDSDIKAGGCGCIIRFGDQIDIKAEPDSRQDLYVRSPTSKSERKCHETKKVAARVGITSAVICGFLVVGLGISRKRMKSKGIFLQLLPVQKKPSSKITDSMTSQNANEGKHNDLDLPLFQLSKIATATRNFSLNNKIGEGGHFKSLTDGQQIAFKRLSTSSQQGIEKFKMKVYS